MTVNLEPRTGAAAAAPVPGRPRSDASIPTNLPVVVAWIAVAVTAVAVAAAAGGSALDATAYLVTWLLSTTLPGVLVWRALAQPSSLVEELGFGNVVGVAMLLLAWAPAVALGQPWLAWCGPTAVIAAFLVVPRLRRHWRSGRDERTRTPRRWHVAMAAVCIAALVRLLVADLRALPLPGTADTRVHPDMWFQLSLINQLQQTLLVEQPQAAGVSMHYHWFANAYIAVTSSMSGVLASTALIHLWLVAMTVSMLLAAAALARRLLDHPSVRRPGSLWWAGPLAAFLLGVLPVVLLLGEPRLRNLGNGFQVVSPSGTLGMVLLIALSGPVIELARGRGGRGTWLLALLLIALSAGTKPSIPPVLVCALLLVGLRHYLVHRRIPGFALGLAAAAAGSMAVASLWVMGGSGSEVDLFRTLILDGQMQFAESGASRDSVRATMAALLLLYTFTELPRLLGMAGVAQAGARTDPATWWCTGVVLAGFCGSWIVSHPGYSQQYFWRIVIAVGVVSTVVAAARAVPADERATALRPVLLVAAAGLLLGTWVLSWAAVDVESPATGAFDRLLPYAAAGVALAVPVWVARRLLARTPLLTLLTAFALAAGTPAAVADLQDPVSRAWHGRTPAYDEREIPRLLTEEEQDAALWLRERADDGDRIATNVMCVPTAHYPGCESTAFWVAALTGRSVVLGGWAYMEQTRENYLQDGGGENYKQQPAPFPARERLSLAVVRNPSAEVVARLRDRYGADWVFADRRATPISPRLQDFAELVYANPDVQIFRLR